MAHPTNRRKSEAPAPCLEPLGERVLVLRILIMSKREMTEEELVAAGAPSRRLTGVLGELVFRNVVQIRVVDDVRRYRYRGGRS